MGSWIVRGICAAEDSLRDYAMAKHVKKSDLPSKVCTECGRPFTWRKKWEKVWDEVKYCSGKCRISGREKH